MVQGAVRRWGVIVNEWEQSELQCVPTSTGVPKSADVYSSSQRKGANDGSAFGVDWLLRPSVF